MGFVNGLGSTYIWLGCASCSEHYYEAMIYLILGNFVYF